MARFTKTQKDTYIDQQAAAKIAAINAITSKANGGGSNTAELMRDQLSAIATIDAITAKELDRQLLTVSPCVATMYLEGSSLDEQGDPNKVFEMSLFKEGEPGGINIDGVETGYQLVPLVTGNSTSGVWPAPSGFTFPSVPFDGQSEIFAGTGATDNMLGVLPTGSFSLIGSCKPDITGNNQANREVEVDIIIFDALGNPVRQLGFAQEANQSSNGRSNSIVTGRLMLNDNFLTANQFVGLGIRKGTLENDTDITISKAFVQISLVSTGA